MKSITILLLLVACSSRPDQATFKSPDEVTNEDFTKERPYKKSEVPGHYQANLPSISPALQDETIDRFSKKEIESISTFTDPLMEISVRCLRGEFDIAFNIASKSFNRYQKIATYWNQVANCHLNQGNERKALLFYNKALEVSKNYVPALNNIGVMYSRQGQDQKALVAFERANKFGKFSKTPRFNLAKTYLIYGLTDLALPIFDSLLGQAPGDVDMLNAVGSSHFINSDYSRAVSYFQKIPQSEWVRPEIGLNFSLALMRSGNKKDASKVFGIIDRPSNQELNKYYSVVKAQIGDAE